MASEFNISWMIEVIDTIVEIEYLGKVETDFG
jgi:hypothetical protein